MPPSSRGTTTEIDPPGAGTLFVHGHASSSKRSSLVRSRSRSRTPVRLRPNSGSRGRKGGKTKKWPPEWQDVLLTREEPLSLPPTSADALLERGIGDYTFLPAPEGLLGRGKFSTVYKVLGADEKNYALKHTPLYPHHPLIAARLLREPTLLAQLPPHPCLVGVEGWIRTEGHFYLIEQYAATHIPLHLHLLPLRPSRAAYILDQLVSVARDCMHRGRICHRDIKGENVLVDVETGDIVVLDLGLATQFSASEPKLTTCCGSPAFHSPEIVHALNHPPGVISYYGPELDIWCIALTLLSLLSSSKFPLGPSHRSRNTMHSRVLDRLQELDIAYPPNQPAGDWHLSAAEHESERQEWIRVRRGLAAFLEMDGRKRMEGFRRYSFGQKWEDRIESWEKRLGREGEKGDTEGGFKQLSFLPTEVKYTLPINVLPISHSTTTSKITLLNPTDISDCRVLSYLKYLLRVHGILYHCIRTPSSPIPLLQLIVPLPPPTEPPKQEDEKTSTPWLSALFRRSRSTTSSTSRSASLPPARNGTPLPPVPSAIPKKNAPVTYLRCYIQIDYSHPPRSYGQSKRNSRAASASATPRSHRPGTSRRSTSTTIPSKVGMVSDNRISEGLSNGEDSLAVASLQQALLKITQLSPTPSSYSRGLGIWPSPTSVVSPTSTSGDMIPSTLSDESNNPSPDISTPTTDGSMTPVPPTPPSKAIQLQPDPSPSPPPPTTTATRPSMKRATTSPRLSYRGLPPISPSLALTPLPTIHPHPLSRQVSRTSTSDEEDGTTGNSKSTSTITSTSTSTSTRSRYPSRPPSRLHSRATSRAPSISAIPTTTTAPKRPGLGSRSNSTVSSSHTGSKDSGSTDYSPPSSEASGSHRPISYVTITVSDERALSVLRKVFDVPHIPTISIKNGIKSPRQGGTEALGIPQSNRDTVNIGEEEEEEEEERGRSRSREEPQTLLSAGVRKVGSGGSDKSKSKVMSKDGGEKRENSTGPKRMFGFLGLGAGLGLISPESGLVGKVPERRGSNRTSSAPPVGV